MFTSRLTIDRQTAIPAEVLEALGLRPGDAIAYAVDEDGRVLLGRTDDPFINPFALFIEWTGDPDREAYADL